VRRSGAKGVARARPSNNLVQDRGWRATVDEDGQYSFAVAL
jgi:hypothetical protein